MAFISEYSVSSFGGGTSFTNAAGTQTAPGAVTLQNGNVAVFYIDGTTLKGQLINGMTGALIGSAVTVGTSLEIPTYANGVPVAVSADVLTNGNIVVTWARNTAADDVLYRIYDPNLSPVTASLSAEGLVDASRQPDVAAFADGTFGIAWAYQDEIRYRHFSASGIALTSEVIAAATGANIEYLSIQDVEGYVAIGYNAINGASVANAVVADIDGTNASIILLDNTGTVNRNVQILGGSNATGITAVWEDSEYLSPSGTDLTVLANFTPTHPALSAGNNGAISASTNAQGLHFVSSTLTFSATDFDVEGLLLAANGTRLTNVSIAASAVRDETGLVTSWISGSSFRAFYNIDTASGSDPDAGIAQTLYTITRTSNGDSTQDLMDFTGDAINDVINSGDGDDVIGAGGGVNSVLAGAGNDQVIIGSADTTANGEAGTDELRATFVHVTAGVSINLSNLWGGGTGTIGNGTVTGFETLGFFQGSPFDDTIVIGANAVLLPNRFVDGMAGNDVIIGSNNDDKLYGGTGFDVIAAGAGNDDLSTSNSGELIGGTGDDTYTVFSNLVSIVELVGEGTDRVLPANLTVFTLPSNVENLDFSPNGSIGASVVGVGNAGNNNIKGVSATRDQLFGRDGNDTLNDGGGSQGHEDTLLGGPGDDIYIVQVKGDSTIELVGEGTDEVQTTFSLYALQANVENLTATNTANHAALVGNIGNNTIRGNTGTDNLFGREGNDTLYGGTGNANTMLGQQGDDTYYVDAIGDSVIEFVGEGTDTVIVSTSTYTLSANVENFVYAGPDVVTAIGNVIGNIMTGGAGGDFLSGGDGADILTGGGAPDTLVGGTSGDQFRYVGNDNVDTIVGFQTGLDKIALSTAFFTPTATVGFVQGSAPVAASTNSTFLYNSTTGIVSYDDDGNGASAAVALASIGAGLSLAAGDFIFF